MTEPLPKSEAHRRAVKLAEAGEHQQALDCMQQYLRAHPDDTQAMNDTGVILYALGRFDDAIELLEQARRQPDDALATTLWNLAEVYLAAGRPRQAAGLFEEMAREEVFNPDIAARAATMLVDQRDLAGAVDVLLLSLREMPQQVNLPPLLDEIRAKRPSVALVCEPAQADQIAGLAEYLAQRYRLALCQEGNGEKLFQVVQSSDVIVTTDNDLDLGDSRQRPRVNIRQAGQTPQAVDAALRQIERAANPSQAPNHQDR